MAHLRVTFRGQSYFGQQNGYVFLVSEGRPGVLGQQILDRGNNCMTTPSTASELRKKLRNRHRRQQRAMQNRARARRTI